MARLESLDMMYEDQLRSEYFLKPPPTLKLLPMLRKRVDRIEADLAGNPIVIGSPEDCGATPFSVWVFDVTSPNRTIDVEFVDGANKPHRLAADMSSAHLHKFGLNDLGIESDRHGLVLPYHPDGMLERCEGSEDIVTRTLYPSLVDQTDPRYSSITDVFVHMDGDRAILEVANITPRIVNIQSVRLDGKSVELPSDYQLPITMEPGSVIHIPLRLNWSPALAGPVVVESNVRGESAVFSENAKPYGAALSASPVPDSNVVKQVVLHSFLTVDEVSRSLQVATGVWQVTDTIIVPAGYTLHIGKNTTLSFGPNTGIVSHGSLLFDGTEENPILLESAGPEQTWDGVVVLGTHQRTRSYLKGVVIRNARAVSRDNWRQTGGVVFYRTNLEFIDSRIEKSNSEDAVNIIHSIFEIRNLTIEDSESDGIDSDFSKGSIIDSAFRNIGRAGGGGDAIDASGSTVVIKNTIVKNVIDKAVSAGEQSQILASHIDIRNVGIGIASKDGSHVSISNSSISDSRIGGLMAYIKKREYGPAKILADKLFFLGAAPKARAQHNSHIILEGVKIPSETFGADELYAN
jgi:hypothetical protein